MRKFGVLYTSAGKTIVPSGPGFTRAGFAEDEPISFFRTEPNQTPHQEHQEQPPHQEHQHEQPPPTPLKLSSRLSASDLAFRAVARGGGLVVLVLMVAVGAFLAYRAAQALHKAGFSFLTTQDWNPDGGGFGIAAVMVGTILIALVAIVVAVPLAMGAALYISEYAPRRIQRLLITGIDLMAAVPSVVFGLWGFFFLEWRMTALSRWINDWFFWIPLFKVNGVTRTQTGPTATFYTSSSFIAGVVVALMVIPIASSIMREAFSQAPPGEREGAYALGATRWGMIRAVVLPFAKGAMMALNHPCAQRRAVLPP
jgi:phosphate transport system permease protein